MTATARPIMKDVLTRDLKSNQAPNVTKIGAILASSVAFATDVMCSDKCHAPRSKAINRPGRARRKQSDSVSGVVSFSSRRSRPSMSRSGKTASARRQKPVASGPTSESRTKIGELPIAIPPTIRAVIARRCALVGAGLAAVVCDILKLKVVPKSFCCPRNARS